MLQHGVRRGPKNWTGLEVTPFNPDLSTGGPTLRLEL